VVAFTRYNMDGDVLLVVVNAGNGQWDTSQYGVNMGGESKPGWRYSTHRHPVYGGVNTVGNYGFPAPGLRRPAFHQPSQWSVLIFCQQ